MDNPSATAVVKKYLPDMFANEQINMARGMTLKAIQQYSADTVTDKGPGLDRRRLRQVGGQVGAFVRVRPRWRSALVCREPARRRAEPFRLDPEVLELRPAIGRSRGF
ncbi:hypothetical protein ACRAWD_27595 [Caulobacter segnis]